MKQIRWRWVGRVVLTVLGGCIALLLLLYVCTKPILGALSYVTRDSEMPDDSRILLSPISVDPEDNAYFVIEEARGHMPQEELDVVALSELMQGTIPWDSTVTNPVLSSYRKSLEALEEIRTKTLYSNPATADPESITLDTPIVALDDYRRLGYVGALKARHLLEQGRYDESVEEAFLVLHYGSLVENAQNDAYITVLVGTAIKQLALDVLEQIKERTDAQYFNTQLNAYNIELYTSTRSGYVDSLKYEYMMTKSALKTLGSEQDDTALEHLGLPTHTVSNYSFRPNETLTLLIGFTEKYIGFMASSCEVREFTREKPYAHPGIVKFLPSPLEEVLYVYTPNLVGKVFLDVYVPGAASLKSKPCAVDDRIARLRI